MEKLRYNRAFKGGMAAILFLLALCGALVSFFVVAKIQYDQLVDGMKPLEATIVDIDLDIHIKGPNEQKITVEYVVDGVVYNRKLETDTEISFAAGRGAHYSVGDKVEISIKDGDNIFMLSSKDPQWPLSRIKEHYNLITYQEYQDGSTRDNLAMLEKYPPEAE